MLATILSAFRVHDIRKKLAFTALVLGLYRLGSHVPVPGVDVKDTPQARGMVRRVRHLVKIDE